MDKIKGQTLIKADGTKVQADDALAGKNIICIYFSAHWCPPCRGFTPVLKRFYDEGRGDAETRVIAVAMAMDTIKKNVTES